MPEYYDDNYGHWENMDDPEMRDFYFKVQRESVWKKCRQCGQRVRLRKEYDLCNSCAEENE
jgi:hypothetical protein